MDSHLLSLFTLHAAAPGVLDVVFGPDGDFEGADTWTGPVWYEGERPSRWLHITMIGGEAFSIVSAEWWPLAPLSLDLRVPSVAARLAGLCARALDEEGIGWVTLDDGEWCLMVGNEPRGWWLPNTGEALLSMHPDLAGPVASPSAFLAALTLALAPKIAALRGGR